MVDAVIMDRKGYGFVTFGDPKDAMTFLEVGLLLLLTFIFMYCISSFIKRLDFTSYSCNIGMEEHTSESHSKVFLSAAWLSGVHWQQQSFRSVLSRAALRA